MPDVRKASAADIDSLAVSLARAFADDPVFDFLIPPRRRDARMLKFFAHELAKVHLRHDEVWTTVNGVQGGALWAPPGKWRQPPLDVLRSLPALMPVLGSRVLRAVKTLNAVEKEHPGGDHYYLAVLGTEPAAQGKGIGGALLAPVLNRCDEEGIGAYLESSKESNIAFYNRFGFNVVRELPFPDGGPSVWTMWRDPQPPSS